MRSCAPLNPIYRPFGLAPLRFEALGSQPLPFLTRLIAENSPGCPLAPRSRRLPPRPPGLRTA